MAKTNTKKSSAPSLHSRAARRATSPSINTDKSLKNVRPPPESLNQRPSVLGLHQNAGVTKKTKRGRKSVLSTRQRRRHERGLARAEEIVDRTAVKMQKSKRAASNIASRKKAWEEVNGSVGKVGGLGSSSNKFAGLADDDDDDDENENEEVESVEEFDDEMGEATPAVPSRAPQGSSAATVAAPPPGDEDEEIL